MWGNIGNFSDLAKAAEELQKQAASQIQTPSTSFGGSLFNMDSLQQNEEEAEQQQKKQPKSKASTTSTNLSAEQQIAQPVMKPLAAVTRRTNPPPKHSVPKGRLKIPQPTKDVVVGESSSTSNGNISSAKPLPMTSSSSLNTTEAGAFDKVAVVNEKKHNGDPVIAEADGEVEEGRPGEYPTDEKSELPTTSHSTEDDEESSTPTLAAAPQLSKGFQEQSEEQPPLTQVIPQSNPLSDENVVSAVPDSASPEESPLPIPEPLLSEPEPEQVVQPEQSSSETASQQWNPRLLESSQPQNGAEPPTTEIMEQFSSQLQRLEENHQIEQEQMRKQYEQKLQELQSQLQTMSHQRQQEQREAQRHAEAWKLQKTSLEHELEGTQELLQAKQKDERKLQDAHLKELRTMEKKMNQTEKAREILEEALKEKEKSLEKTNEEVQGARDEYDTLKERVKVVAGELKDRRAECRTLKAEVDLLKDNNVDLQDKITILEAQGMDLNKSSTETSNELNTLKAQLLDKEKELTEAKEGIEAETRKSEDALSAYKRKAQQSLSLANSRIASAVQAKEEAEMEARAARSTADSAMERAMAAERKGTDALAEAKAYVAEMKDQVGKLDDVKTELEATRAELETIRSEAQTTKEASEKLSCELQSIHGRLEAEQMTTTELRGELSNVNTRSTELMEEVDRLLREEKRLVEELRRLKEDGKKDKSKENGVDADDMVPAKHSAEAEGMIAMLQQELADANLAIRELKETLKATVDEASRTSEPSRENGGNNVDSATGGMPLFYAMEKQAELTQARNEIARLAALVGDSESSKQEAMEHMEMMREQLEEAHSKLERESRRSTPQEERLNLEYLKNVILSYLNAKTVLEKKTLLPVIGTVLCLTPQEQQQALQHLDQEGKLSLDSVTSSVMNLRWS